MKRIKTSMAKNPHKNPYATCMRKPVSVPRWEKNSSGDTREIPGETGNMSAGMSAGRAKKPVKTDWQPGIYTKMGQG